LESPGRGAEAIGRTGAEISAQNRYQQYPLAEMAEDILCQKESRRNAKKVLLLVVLSFIVDKNTQD
jgi:hypothetical protein